MTDLTKYSLIPTGVTLTITGVILILNTYDSYNTNTYNSNNNKCESNTNRCGLIRTGVTLIIIIGVTIIPTGIILIQSNLDKLNL